MTRYLVSGAGGMLGADLRLMLADRDVTALARSDLDITDASAVRDAVAGHDVVINAAAYTKVDDAESDEAAAFAVNARGAGNLADASATIGARFVQVSTDYVFDGTASSPYSEDTPRAPLGAYGRSKAAGEELVLRHPHVYLVRTAWLYGEHGPNFARTMLRLAAERDTVAVVTDQVGQPTWSRDLAAAIVRLLDAEAPFGIYHGTNSGQASWFEFARAIFEDSGLDSDRVRPIDSAAFERPAPRPAYSVLGHAAWGAAGLPAPRPWREALRAALDGDVITASA
jgi:dTDP-4-dehydrorhamnose reductase